MSPPRVQLWGDEIRSFLLGRISKNRIVEMLDRVQSVEFSIPPICRWWIFEGKQYRPLGGPMSSSWQWISHNAALLNEMFNPRIRVSERIEGSVDWAQTLSRSPGHVRREYVVRSSGIGLDEPEREALHGWVGWITQQWAEYTRNLGAESHLRWPMLIGESHPIGLDTLRRWAHVARRSRWPLLRGVISESLRPMLEPEELDRIPLPTDEPTLFELLCLVRIARAVAPAPADVRWLSRDTDNTIHVGHLAIQYQQTLKCEHVKATCGDDASLREALDLFDIRLPSRLDLAFDFCFKTLSRFDGIIAEVKSGGRQFEDTISQLRTYRAARPRRTGTRYLIWGIVENPVLPDLTVEQYKHMFATADQATDTWVFSSAEAIPAVMQAALSDPTETRRGLDRS